MCVNKSQKARFFKLLGLVETTEVLQKNRGQTHKNDRNKNETQLKAEEHEHDGSCCLKRTREQTSEVYMINQCQASVNDIDYQHDIMEDVVTFKDIHEQNTSKKETQIDLNHSHDEKVEDGVQRVEDGIMELKEIMIQIKKMIGYPENKTTPDKSLRLKQVKPTRKKLQKKPQYFRTKANEKTVNLRQKGIKENPYKKHVDNLFIVINGIRKKQKSNRYYKQRHSYLQIILQTWINSQRKSRTNKDSKKMLLKLPKHIRSSILQLRHERRNALINVYPIERQGINDYFQNLNLENGNSDTRHPMSYEWFRFGSYARYPENAPVRPIRLSAAGFFATGNGDEVKCFSCGVTYSNWLADDEAINVHRRISPHCEFVCNFDANIPISQPLNERSENNVLHGDSATAQRSEHSIEDVTNLQRESYPSNTQNTSLSEHNTYDQIVRENETCTNHIQHNV
ncbi:hypothetical protein KUTeg_007874 [Tegillarca granosa]|uniref:Uncharacterized protein n=1 Tax=Tegillarca granosa TaxID=220873 RepID=A0ABQ9FEK6_TEGGR|nr:hypothetical protein KUTeg_007874 [Tegillarca granosa]